MKQISLKKLLIKTFYFLKAPLLCVMGFSFVCCVILFCAGIKISFAENEHQNDADYQGYVDFFEEVYETMNENYYKPIKREAFDQFIKTFDEKIYSELKDENRSSDYVRWRSAAFMIDFLKEQEDVFSAFFPPKPAKKYEEKALGKKNDLGIEGNLIDEGYQTTQVEPRSDAYKKGLRINDIITRIDGKKVSKLSPEEITAMLTPLVGSKVKLEFLKYPKKTKKKVVVTSMEYFKQTVFMTPVSVPGVYCLKLEKFNRKTSDDLFRFLNFIKQQKEVNGLILDLRDNPGGPPLAAREISSFFLTPGEEFAYFERNNKPNAVLDVPSIPKKYHYKGPMVILVNENSGSASELFSGILQKKGRAILLGTNSAGQVMLKSMFHFSDDSMVLLITARGHHPDGSVFSFDGLVPNKYITEDETDDLVNYAATYLAYIKYNK